MKVDRVFLKSNKIIQLNRWEIKIRPGLKEKDFDATRKAIEKLNPDEK